MIRQLMTSLVLLSAAGVVFAQQSGETIQVNLIEIPVTVIDGQGQPVRGLTATNFELYDAGQKREISNFEVVDLAERPPAGAGAESSSKPLQRRQLMILFDATNSTPSSLLRVRQAAADFVTNRLRRRDLVAVGQVSAREGFRLLSSFTTDRRLSLAAIDTMGSPKQFSPRDPLLLSGADITPPSSAPGAAEPGRAAAATEEVVLEHLKAISNAQAKLDKEAQRQLLSRQLQALTEMGRMLDRVRGRKHVVLLSEGFDAKLLQGRLGTVDQRTEERQAVESGEIWKSDSDSQYGSTESTGELRRLTAALRRSDVVLHAIDIKGVRTDVDVRDGVQASSAADSLHLLTRDSGGTVFRNTNELTANFERLLKQDEVTYVLAFVAPSTAPGKFHDVKVRVAGVPGGRVIHRAGYYEPSPSVTENERRLAAADIVMNALPVDDLKVASFAAAVPRKLGAALVPVVLEIEGRSILGATADKTARLEFFVYAFDEEGIIRDFSYQPVGLDLAKVRSKLGARGVKFFNTLRLGTGQYSIRVLVRSGVRNGFAMASLRVPPPGERFVMPPLVFDPSTDWVMVKPPDREAGMAYPFQVSEDVFVPAVRPAVTIGSTIQVALFGSNVPPGTLRLDAALQRGDAVTPLSVKFLGRAPDADLVKLVYELPMTQLGAGTYSLLLDVIDGTAKQRTVVPLTAK